MSASSSSSSGISFTGLLTIVFIVLKFTHYIDWQWKWVLAPLWIPIVLLLGFLVVWMVVAGLIAFRD